MPEDPTPPPHRAPRGRAHGSEGPLRLAASQELDEEPTLGSWYRHGAIVLVVLLVVLLVSAGGSPKKTSAAQKPSATTAPTASTISHKDPKPGRRSAR